MHGYERTKSICCAMILALAIYAAGTESVSAAGGFTISGTPTGFTSNFSMTANVQVAPGDTGKNGVVYVAANIGGAWYFRNSAGAWNAWNGGAFPAPYYSGALGNHAVAIVDRVNLTGLPGADVYVGYGLDQNDMVNNAKFSKVFSLPPPVPPLTAARSLVGTWKTAFPVTVYFKTDWCGRGLSLVASQPWNVTFTVTRGQDDNHVSVDMDFTTSAFTTINGCPGTGIVPEVPPLTFAGLISSSNLVLSRGTKVVGEFNFTTDILTGTFDYTWTAVYSQEEYTATNALILIRQ